MKFEMIGVSMISPEGFAMRRACRQADASGSANAGARVRHHVDRVHRLLTAAVVELDGLECAPSSLRRPSRSPCPRRRRPCCTFSPWVMRPVIVLLLVFLHERFGVADDLHLRVRNDHVVLPNENAGAAGMREAELHDPVAEDDRVLLTAMAIDRVITWRCSSWSFPGCMISKGTSGSSAGVRR